MSLLIEGIHKQVEGIKFGILSPNMIRKFSVVEVNTADTYDEDGIPIMGGLMDGRLGTLEPRQRCKTCGNTATECPGHFGHIELAVPIIHVEFTKLIYKLLRTTCGNCGRVSLPDDRISEIKVEMNKQEEMYGSVLDDFYKDVEKEAIKYSNCPHCGMRIFKIKFNKPTSFYEEIRDGGARILNPNMIRERLERIPDEDLIILGINPEVARPEWMILSVLPVPPVYVRPSITLQTGIRSEDDLTHKLVDIIRINQRLKENIDAGAPTLIIQDLSELLQYHITTYFNNQASGIPPARHRSGRALKTLSQRLKGKEGRFRSNLSGKRVDFSARTVISPDSNLDINEVGVPVEIAKRLTIPEKVTPWNIETLKKFIVNGPDNYPGALYVIRPDGKRIRLEFVIERDKVAEAIQPGFIVERHLRDGDVAIFNRQPSLHRMSIMTHKVKVLPYKTFRLHLSVCPPYNADFDGDEMNLHVPQSEEARTEARILMQVQDQILSPRYGGPIIGAIQDFITASYILTKKDTLLNKKQVSRLLTVINYDNEFPKPTYHHPEELWTGKQIFSLLLPDGLNYSLKSSVCQSCTKCLKQDCPYDAFVIVKNGELLNGVIDKNSIGAEKSESLYHRIIKDFSSETGRQFLNSMSKMLNEYITMIGFTFSINELDLPEDTIENIKLIIQKAEDQTNNLIQDYNNGTLNRLPGKTLEESLETFIMQVLAEARNKSGNAADNVFSMENHGIVMTKTGARGSNLNFGQMTACLGQQAVRGKRIFRGYRNRALSHFKPNDQTPKARGFITSNYRDGLGPTDFFFHAMGGREGLVDTAVRTQQSGYMQRRLINALEFLRVEYDSTVRTSNGDIVEFNYGEDNVDPAKSDHGKAVNITQLINAIDVKRDDNRASTDYIKRKLKSVDRELTPILVSELRRQSKEEKLNNSEVRKIITLTLDNYKKSLVEPGEAVGIIAAQSIGEPGTQMTLRTFHYAGVSEMNVTLGLPRLIEIVDARKAPSTPIMMIFLDEEHRKSREKANIIAQKILYTNLEDITSIHEIDMISNSIIIKLDLEMMKNRGISLQDLSSVLVFKDADVKIKDSEIEITSNEIDNIDLFKFESQVLSTDIKGIRGIDRVLIDQRDGEWVINTTGSNLIEVLKVQGVDSNRAITNDIHEMAETLGIESARNLIIREAVSVLEEQGLDVDVRHVMLVADAMTSSGAVLQIGRHGLSGRKDSVLARAAFEITVPTIVDAASKGSIDLLGGVTESVIVGQRVPVGTGLIELFMGPSYNTPLK